MISKRKKTQISQLWTSYSINPRGDLWRKDEQSFGHKLLKKMGWQKGEGLGKDGTGITEPIHPVQTQDNEGLGYGARAWDYSWNWLSHQDDYTSLLSQLQQQHSESAESKSCGDSNSVPANSHVTDLVKKAKKSRKRVHYQRNIQGKNMKNCSQADWNSILGIKRKKKLPEDEVDAVLATDNTQEKLTISPVTSHTYFMEKRLRMEEKQIENDELVHGTPKEKLEKENYCQAEDSLIVLRKTKKMKKRKKRMELKMIFDLTNVTEDSGAAECERTLHRSNIIDHTSPEAMSVLVGILKTSSEITRNGEIDQKKSVTFLDKPFVSFVPAHDSMRGGAWIWKKKGIISIM